MTYAHRQEALRRAAHFASLAALIRLEAQENRDYAAQDDVDEHTRRWVESANLTVDRAAEINDEVAGKYLAIFGGQELTVEDADDDRDVDGWS